MNDMLIADLSSLTHFAWDSRILTPNYLSRPQGVLDSNVSLIYISQQLLDPQESITYELGLETYKEVISELMYGIPVGTGTFI